jgi:F-type H+-transporting ATPase subunit a
MASSALLFVIGILPLGLILGIMCLESAIACIQAYVFCILTSSYIKDALYAH